MHYSPLSLRSAAQHVFDFSLFAALIVAPLFMGGRGPIGKYVFVIFVAAMTLAWTVQFATSANAKISLTGGELFIVVGILLLFVQLLPFQEDTLLTVSPSLGDYLPTWFSSDAPNHVQVGTWHSLSVSPEGTRRSLAMFLSYGMFFVLVVQRIRSVEDVEWLIRLLAYGTAGLAVIALIQLFFGNGKFLWVYEHPSRTTAGNAKGPFQNQNHFAHMMALGIGPLVWMLLIHLPTGKTRFRKMRMSFGNSTHPVLIPNVIKIAAAIAIVTLTVLLTNSRGGVMTFVIAGVTVLGITCWHGHWRKGSLRLVIGVMAFVLAAIGILGYERLSNRLLTLVQADSVAELSRGRYSLWSGMLEASREFPAIGMGFGSHADVYPAFMKENFGVEFTHGESGYLSLLMEGGVGAVLLLTGAIALLLRWLVPMVLAGAKAGHDAVQRKLILAAAPITAGIVASLVHSIGDFVWYVTACMSWTIVVIAVLSRLQWLFVQAGDGKAKQRSRVTFLMTPEPSLKAVIVVCFVAFNVYSLATLYAPAKAAVHWNEYRCVSRNGELSEQDLRTTKIELLQKVVSVDPANTTAQLRLAEANWQDLRSSGGQGSEASVRAVRRYATNAICLGPMRGRGYALLCASHTSMDEAKAETLFAQAFKVREYDAIVHMIRGKMLIENAKVKEGFSHWRIAFNLDLEVRTTLIERLHRVFPAMFLMEQFDPDISGLWELHAAYKADGNLSSINGIAERLIARITERLETMIDSEQAAIQHVQLYSLQMQLERPVLAGKSLIRAIEMYPDNYQNHRLLAYHFYHQQEFANALRQFRWCAARHSDDLQVQDMIEQCVRKNLAAQPSENHVL